MTSCPRCAAQNSDDNRFCGTCGLRFAKRDDVTIGDPTSAIIKRVRTLMRREIKDRDVVEVKTAQAAAEILREWFKWIGGAAGVVIVVIGAFGIKLQWDLNSAVKEAKAEADKVVQAAQKQVKDIDEQIAASRVKLKQLESMTKEIEDVKAIVDAQRKTLADLPDKLRFGTFSSHVEKRSEVEVNFDFDVTLAFVIPISGFENITWIEAIDATDIRPNQSGGSTVTVSFKKKADVAYVGYRVIAIGFGHESSGKVKGGGVE